MRALLTSLVLILAAGCSTKVSLPDRPGPVWPDLRPDRRALADQRGDLRRDGGRDGTLADRPPPDRWIYDFRPEAQPKPGWQKVPLLLASDLHALACVAGHVFAVGAEGTILHRGPSDTTFMPQLPPASADQLTNLYAVSFADATYGVAAGKDYRIWQTKDLGATWEIAPQCSAYLFDTFYSLHLAGPQEGFGAGVAVNSQGAGTKYFNPPGYSWVCSSPTFAGEIFYGVFRVAKNGWAVGDTGGKIYRTIDEGVTWSPVATGVSKVLRGISFVSSGVGVAVGEAGTILRSTDAGAVWSALSPATGASLWKVFFPDPQNGWAVGEAGTILRTSNGGASWSAQASGVQGRLEGVCFSSATEGWVVGEKGMMLHTSSGGI